MSTLQELGAIRAWVTRKSRIKSLRLLARDLAAECRIILVRQVADGLWRRYKAYAGEAASIEGFSVWLNYSNFEDTYLGIGSRGVSYEVRQEWAARVIKESRSPELDPFGLESNGVWFFTALAATLNKKLARSGKKVYVAGTTSDTTKYRRNRTFRFTTWAI